jgi:hypothetical protein
MHRLYVNEQYGAWQVCRLRGVWRIRTIKFGKHTPLPCPAENIDEGRGSRSMAPQSPDL